MDAKKPRPLLDEVNRSYWQGCERGVLLLQECEGCGGLSCPPQAVCPVCGGQGFSWRPASGRARLWSWLRMHRAYFPAWQDSLPYVVLLAQLEEGPILISRPASGQDRALSLGLELQLEFEEGLPVFRPL